MVGPLQQFKADYFRCLAHPVRIRILELLRGGELTVGELQVQVRFSWGGFLRIAARGAGGELLGAECEIHDASGATIPAQFKAVADVWPPRWSTRLWVGVASQVEQPLLPGHYKVHLQMTGYRGKDAEVDVEAKTNSLLEVTLAPE